MDLRATCGDEHALADLAVGEVGSDVAHHHKFDGAYRRRRVNR